MEIIFVANACRTQISKCFKNMSPEQAKASLPPLESLSGVVGSATKSVHTQSWNMDEYKALLEFVLLYSGEENWYIPQEASPYWNSASKYVSMRAKSCRTGKDLILLLSIYVHVYFSFCL